jgi:hypothetical protein
MNDESSKYSFCALYWGWWLDYIDWSDLNVVFRVPSHTLVPPSLGYVSCTLQDSCVIETQPKLPSVFKLSFLQGLYSFYALAGLYGWIVVLLIAWSLRRLLDCSRYSVPHSLLLECWLWSSFLPYSLPMKPSQTVWSPRAPSLSCMPQEVFSVSFSIPCVPGGASRLCVCGRQRALFGIQKLSWCSRINPNLRVFPSQKMIFWIPLFEIFGHLEVLCYEATCGFVSFKSCEGLCNFVYCRLNFIHISLLDVVEVMSETLVGFWFRVF